MTKSFRHNGLERYYRTGSKAGIQPKHDKKLRTQLSALDTATQPQDLAAIPSWRLTFTFEGTDVVLVDYEDYH